MRPILFIPVLCAFAILPSANAGKPRETEAAKLERLLAGKVAGKPQSCLPLRQSSSSEVLNGSIIFRQSSKRLYRNEAIGGCEAQRAGEALVFRTSSSSLCHGDVAQIIDLRSGMYGGHCILGDFVPYEVDPKG